MINNTFVLKDFIEFMWKKYNVSICFISENMGDKNILGKYLSYDKEKREKEKVIFINIENIDDNTTKIFVLLHEVGHFLLEKSKFIQKEEYANFLGYYLMRKFNIEKENISNSKFIKKLNLVLIFLLEENIRRELLDIGKLFCYSYFKFLKGDK